MNHNAFSNWNWVLASGSPRRIELLKRIVEKFEVLPADIEETLTPDLAPKDQAMNLAFMKAEAVSKRLGSRQERMAIIAADTMVVLDDSIFGKPENESDAIRMLEALSGRTHLVVTGVCMLTPYRTISFGEETSVTFRQLSREEIENYVATREPMDKAGAYAIQGGATSFVESIEGDIDNVIGLPVTTLKNALSKRII